MHNARWFIEDTPQKCFSYFTNKNLVVNMSKRTADANPSTKLFTNTNKLMENSAYGVVLMRTDKHRIINYFSKITNIATGFNMSLFCRFEKLDDNVFQIQHAKSRVIHNFYTAVCSN